jgi:hypothetical protein
MDIAYLPGLPFMGKTGRGLVRVRVEALHHRDPPPYRLDHAL